MRRTLLLIACLGVCFGAIEAVSASDLDDEQAQIARERAQHAEQVKAACHEAWPNWSECSRCDHCTANCIEQCKNESECSDKCAGFCMENCGGS